MMGAKNPASKRFQEWSFGIAKLDFVIARLDEISKEEISTD